MLKKYCLVFFLIIFLPLSGLALEKQRTFICKGSYDIYDDTCYFESGAFVFFGYGNGEREIQKNGKAIRYFFWFNGDPYMIYRKNLFWLFW